MMLQPNFGDLGILRIIPLAFADMKPGATAPLIDLLCLNQMHDKAFNLY